MSQEIKEPDYRAGEHTAMALMAQDIKYMRETVTAMKGDIKELKDELEGKYVTSVEFEPIKRLVYGTVGIILTAVVTALVLLVLKD